MRTLDRYLLRSFFYNYLASLSVLISMYIVLDLFLNLDEFTEGHKTTAQLIWDISNYYVYNIPLYFSQLSGIITLFAACFTLARLQWANETTAMLASGVSLYRMAAPVVVAGFCMNVLLVANYELLLPAVAPKLARNRDDVEGARVYDLWFVKDDHRLVSAQRFRPVTGEIRGLYIVELSTRPGERGRLAGAITADEAQWDPDARGWTLTGGRHYDLSQDELASVTPVGIKFYPSSLSPQDMVLRKMAAWTQFLSTSQLNQLVEREKSPARSIQVNQIKHTRFTQPIINMILLLLGISFFLNRLPEGVLSAGAKALGTCAFACMMSFAGQHLIGAFATVFQIPVPLALPAWVPIFLFGPLAILLLDNVKT
jgi:lipopolysaccharide export system permease protein